MRYERASCGPSNEPHKISPERAQSGGQGGGRWRRDRRRQVVAPCRTPARAPCPCPCPCRPPPLLRLLLQAPYSYMGRRRVVRAQAGRSRRLRVTLLCLCCVCLSLSLSVCTMTAPRAYSLYTRTAYTTVAGNMYVRRIAVAVVMAANTYAYTRCDLIPI